MYVVRGVIQPQPQVAGLACMTHSTAPGDHRTQPHPSAQGKLKKKRMTKYAFDAATSRVVPLTDDSPSWGKHFGQADLVIEVRMTPH